METNRTMEKPYLFLTTVMGFIQTVILIFLLLEFQFANRIMRRIDLFINYLQYPNSVTSTYIG